MPDVLTILSIMPKKVKRKSSFGRPSASDGAKRKAKYSQEKDDFNENLTAPNPLYSQKKYWGDNF